MIFKINSKEIDVPLDNKMLIITGYNNPFKLELIRKIKDYYKSLNDVLYFSEDRRITISKEIMESVDTMRALLNIEPLKDSLSKSLDIYDYFALENLQYGQPINSGYLQLINLYYNIAMTPTKLSLIVERVELNYHITLLNYILSSFLDSKITTKFHNIIVTTYDEKIYMPRLKKCIFNIDQYL